MLLHLISMLSAPENFLKQKFKKNFIPKLPNKEHLKNHGKYQRLDNENIENTKIIPNEDNKTENSRDISKINSENQENRIFQEKKKPSERKFDKIMSRLYGKGSPTRLNNDDITKNRKISLKERVLGRLRHHNYDINNTISEKNQAKRDYNQKNFSIRKINNASFNPQNRIFSDRNDNNFYDETGNENNSKVSAI
ncbi:hypothetical protein DMUE_4032 [Dictyocoela muelleri]|nr:hypothetical protein DMUE_4032 [Dictyocoela muelleri]